MASPTYGLLSTGLVIPTIDEIRTDIETELRAAQGLGPSMPMGDGTLLGHLGGIVSERLALVWQGLQAVNASQDPDQAVGAGLDVLCTLTGTYRDPATYSQVTETLCGTDGTVVAAGNLIATSAGKVFKTAADVTIVAIPGWTPTTNYAVGARVTNAGRCYQCTIAGTSAGAGGPNTTVDPIVDNTVTWEYLGDGTAAIDVLATSVDTGAIVAVANDLTVIQTPISGWSTARNMLDATLGADAQVDESLRLSREAEVEAPGSGTADAIRAALLTLSGVTTATVFFNDTDATDSNGLTPHSCEAMVQGGASQDIWDCMWQNVPLGIGMLGDQVGTSLDSEGVAQTVRFTRPTEVDIYVDVTLVKDPTTYAGDAALQAAISTWGQGRGTGYDAVASAISAACFGVAGVLDVTLVKIGTAPAPAGSATIAIDDRSLAVYDTSRITVHSSDGTP